MGITVVTQPELKTTINSEDYLEQKNTVLIPPKSTAGISGFEFDILSDETLNLEGEVSQNTIQSGSFINDHFIEKPSRVTLSGFIGELVSLRSSAQRGLQSLGNKLTAVDAYAGDYTPGMTQKINKTVADAQPQVGELNANVNKSKNIVNFFGGETESKTRQQEAYSILRAMFKSKTIVSVLTPWEYFDAMIITSVRVTQGETSQDITDISVTLTEVRFAELEFTNFDESLFPPANDVQNSEEQDAGTAKTRDSSVLLDIEEGVVKIIKQ